MKFEVTGRHRETGDEQTLTTDAADEREAAERAAVYGIVATDVRRVDGHGVTPAPPGSRGGGGRSSVRAILSAVLLLLAVGLTALRVVRVFTGGDSHKPPTIDADELRRLSTPPRPAWAEDALRQMNREADQLKDAPPAPASATQPSASTRPATPGGRPPTSLTRLWTDPQGRTMQEIGWKIDGRWVKGVWRKEADGQWVRVN